MMKSLSALAVAALVASPAAAQSNQTFTVSSNTVSGASGSAQTFVGTLEFLSSRATSLSAELALQGLTLEDALGFQLDYDITASDPAASGSFVRLAGFTEVAGGGSRPAGSATIRPAFTGQASVFYDFEERFDLSQVYLAEVAEFNNNPSDFFFGGGIITSGFGTAGTTTATDLRLVFAPVPEPASLALLGLGSLALLGRRRK